LAVGDTIFRYTAEGESLADFWIKAVTLLSIRDRRTDLSGD